MPIVRNHTALDNRTAIEERTKNSGETIKQVFWQTSINEQRPKLKIWINDIVIKGLVDTGVDVTIISSESWHSNWPLQDTNIQFLEIETLYQVKQNTRWVEWIRLEGQREILKPYVASIAINLQGCDLLQ